MNKSTYNLQIPISKELEIKLKDLAKEDERSLRVFCKKILQDYVDGKITIDNNAINNNIEDDAGSFNFESLD